MRSANISEGFSKSSLLKKYAILLFILLLLVIISLILFNGYLKEGMDNDEVLRIIPIIQYFNKNATPINQSIFSIHLLGHTIPIMYKQYISSLYPFLYIPIVLFNNYFVGVRFMHLFYFIISILVFFIVFYRENRFVGLWSSLMIVTSPLLYPQIREGFLHTWHFIAVALSFYFFKKFFNGNKKKCVYLFLSVFILSFMTNLVFYFSWIFAAFILSSFVLFYDYWLMIIKSVKCTIVSIIALLVGLFNYVIYNILNGYPTVMELYLSIFNRAKYNQNPIDYHKLGSFSKELKIKVICLSKHFGKYYIVYLALLVLIILLNIIVFYILIKKKEFKKNRIYFLPFMIFIFAFVFILISPKAYRAGHFVFLFPEYQLSMTSVLYLLKEKVLNGKLYKCIVYAGVSSIVMLNFYVSYGKILEINATGGTGLHTTAIFKLEKYIKNKKININDFVFLQWGMSAQLYLFNKGEMRPDSLVFALFNKTPEERNKILLYYFLEKNDMHEKNYFPLFFRVNYKQIDSVRRDFINFVRSNGGKLKIDKIFYEKNSNKKAIILYSIENIRKFRKKLVEKIEHKLKLSNKIRIIKYGFNKAGDIWVIAKGITKNTLLVINKNKFYPTVFGKTYLTAALNLKKFRFKDKKYKYELQLCDLEKYICSYPVLLKYGRKTR